MSDGRTRTLIAGLVLAAGAAAVAEGDRKSYLPEARQEAGALLARVEALPTDGPDAGRALARLLVRAADPEVASLLVEVQPPTTRALGGSGDHYRGLWTELVCRGRALEGDAAQALTVTQEEDAAAALRSQRPPGLWERVMRFPFAEVGRAAARQLADRAFEGGDRGRARMLLELVGLPQPPGSMAAAPAVAGLDAPPGARLTLVSSTSFEALSARAGAGAPSPAVPLVFGDRICAANGAEVRLLDLKGEAIGVVPLDARAAARPRLSTEVACAVGGGAVFAPIVLDRSLVPGRLGGGRGDASFAGEFHALVALDARDGRLLWWDGDPGPCTPAVAARGGQGPPGWPAAADLLRRGHVLACAADGARVYAAITVKAEAPELHVVAFTRRAGDGQALVLEPAWAAPRYLLAAERPGDRSSEDRPVSPELAARLTVDGSGRLLCATDVGVTFGLEAATGVVLWAHRSAPSEDATPDAVRLHRLFRPDPTSGDDDGAPGLARVEPARVAQGASGPVVILLSGASVIGLRPSDGGLAWYRPRGPLERVAVGPSQVAVYGDTELKLFDPDGRELAGRRSLPRIVGQLAWCGDGTVVIPAEAREGRVGYQLLRLDVDGRSVRPAAAWPGADLHGPFNAAAFPGGVVVASRSRIKLLRWTSP